MKINLKRIRLSMKVEKKVVEGVTTISMKVYKTDSDSNGTCWSTLIASFSEEASIKLVGSSISELKLSFGDVNDTVKSFSEIGSIDAVCGFIICDYIKPSSGEEGYLILGEGNVRDGKTAGHGIFVKKDEDISFYIEMNKLWARSSTTTILDKFGDYRLSHVCYPY